MVGGFIPMFIYDLLAFHFSELVVVAILSLIWCCPLTVVAILCYVWTLSTCEAWWPFLKLELTLSTTSRVIISFRSIVQSSVSDVVVGQFPASDCLSWGSEGGGGRWRPVYTNR